MVVQLTRTGVVVGRSGNLTRAREAYEREHCVVLPNVLDCDLLTVFQGLIAQTEFRARSHQRTKEWAADLSPADTAINGRLLFFFNDPKLFQLMQQITGCDHIGCFSGGLYRMSPGARHYDTWHEDLVRTRMVAMSLNLSDGTFAGGELQIRERESGRIVYEMANTGLGDAVIFRIAPQLQHRVLNTTGAVSRTALTGWFQCEPEYLSYLHSTVSRAEG